mgnify:FL=1|tara:strand:- start:155 stop:544 length:390 start_codon:yes stop_codon:yes gene_type:complete
MIPVMRTALINDSATTALVSTRIFPYSRMSSGKENLPALLWDIQGDELMPTFTKDSLKKSTVSMMAISQSVSVSESVVDAVANVLDGFTGTGVSSCRLVATETGEIEPFDGGDDYYYTHTLTLEVWHTT